MKFTFVHSIEECKKLWDTWSPKTSLYHLWEYRLPFLEVYNFPLSFAVFEDGGEVIGMLPLWLHPDQNKYMWYGDVGDEYDWQEDNIFWVKDRARVPEMLSVFDKALHLTALTEAAAQSIGESPYLKEGFPKSVLSFETIHSLDEYLMLLPKKLRQNTRREKRRVEEVGAVLTHGPRDDFATLLKLNTSSFDDSPFHDKRLAEVFTKIVQQETVDSYGVDLLTLKLGNDIVGVDCIFKWGAIYYALLCGYDKVKCPGVGHYMNLMDVEDALATGAKFMDLGETESGMLKEKQFPLTKQFVYSKE